MREKETTELLKYGDEDLCKRIHHLITLIWSQLNIPNDWLVGFIQPTYKKGNKLECSSYRPITLLNDTYKVLSGAIYNTLVKYAEEIL